MSHPKRPTSSRDASNAGPDEGLRRLYTCVRYRAAQVGQRSRGQNIFNPINVYLLVYIVISLAGMECTRVAGDGSSKRGEE
ncbi:hypothetical protein VTN49DRAFT_2204 [Thermomyces lanuginosus]|uniref:uncharacterized protein n=1 Tax=Thermomyces lanuginosus TaxID=5541 RepID=UPI003742BCB0